jgi:hypothetical protein
MTRIARAILRVALAEQFLPPRLAAWWIERETAAIKPLATKASSKRSERHYARIAANLCSPRAVMYGRARIGGMLIIRDYGDEVESTPALTAEWGTPNSCGSGQPFMRSA